MATVLRLVAVLLLLVAGLSSQSVAARGCLSKFTGLFCGHATAAKNYVTLAEHLFKATQSCELAGNTKAAGSLISERSGASEDLIKLVNAFKSLESNETDLKSLCSNDNLANMRRVAEAMRDGGNLRAKRITKPIKRLNFVMVESIALAKSVCPAYLDTKWPASWEPKFTNADMQHHVEQLWRNADSLSQQDDSNGRYKWGSGLSTALQHDVAHDLNKGRSVNPECDQPLFTTDEDVLADQLREYILKPCREFVEMREASEVLRPHSDLLMSWFIIKNGMKDYWSNKSVFTIPTWHNYDNYNEHVNTLALGYLACQRVIAMPEKDVVHRLRKARERDELEVASVF